MVDMSDRLDELPLGYLLHRALNVLRADVLATVLEPAGLTFAQYICLQVLSRYADRSNAELARDINVSPQAMNTVLRSLEERGFVTRPASVSSGRSLPAQLTRDGNKVLRRTEAGVRAAEHRLLGNVSNRARDEFRKVLQKLGPEAEPYPARGAAAVQLPAAIRGQGRASSSS